MGCDYETSLLFFIQNTFVNISPMKLQGTLKVLIDRVTRKLSLCIIWVLYACIIILVNHILATWVQNTCSFFNYMAFLECEFVPKCNIFFKFYQHFSIYYLFNNIQERVKVRIYYKSTWLGCFGNIIWFWVILVFFF